jgi:hypothetical protein
VHSLKIDQDSTTGADWDLSISNVGASNDSLPYAKDGGMIGGTNNDFIEEWLPINLSSATAVNIATTITGTDDDTVDVIVLNENDEELDAVTVYVGETTWTTVDLPAGTSRIKLAADGNTGQAEYDIEVSAIPSAASYSWQGEAIDVGENSHIRVSFPTSGVYTFNYGVDEGNGRYQFLVNGEYIQKTVEVDNAVAYYVPAGTHDLYINQDSDLGADWNLDISGPIAPIDALPYEKMSGEIGGTDNDFTEEWLPIYLGEDTPVNAFISITGDAADSLSIEVWNASTLVETINPVYGTESLWATFTMPTNGRLNLIAAGNDSVISYEIKIIDIPEPAFSWEGTSLKDGLNSTIDMYIPVGGTYNIQGNYPVGFASLAIDPGSPALPALPNEPFSPNADLNMNVDLEAGMHSFVVNQGSSWNSSTWVYSITLVTAYTPTISSVTPDVVNAGTETTITVNGSNFNHGVVVKLIGSSTYTLVTTRLSDSQVTAVVPVGVDVDNYDVQVINPDTKSDTLEDGLQVVSYYVFLPLIINGD